MRLSIIFRCIDSWLFLLKVSCWRKSISPSSLCTFLKESIGHYLCFCLQWSMVTFICLLVHLDNSSLYVFSACWKNLSSKQICNKIKICRVGEKYKYMGDNSCSNHCFHCQGCPPQLNSYLATLNIYILRCNKLFQARCWNIYYKNVIHKNDISYLYLCKSKSWCTVKYRDTFIKSLDSKKNIRLHTNLFRLGFFL